MLSRNKKRISICQHVGSSREGLLKNKYLNKIRIINKTDSQSINVLSRAGAPAGAELVDPVPGGADEGGEGEGDAPLDGGHALLHVGDGGLTAAPLSQAWRCIL